MNPDQSPELTRALAEFARVEAELDASIKRIRDALAASQPEEHRAGAEEIHQLEQEREEEGPAAS